MLKKLTNGNMAMSLPRLQLLSTRLTIGSAVCFTEGLFTSLMVLVPQNNWYYIIGALLSFCIWLVSFRFRDTKMGADVSDLCFIELLVRVAMPLLYYTNTINVDNFKVVYFWYAFTAISIIKILRVYLWEQSITQQHGWGIFGLMTYRYAKHYAPNAPTIANKQRIILAAEILLVMIIAGGCSIWNKRLEDYERVLLMWVVPFTFEFWLGPVQLRMVRDFSVTMLSKITHADAKDAEIQRLQQELAAQKNKNGDLKKEIDALRQLHAVPKKAHTDLIEAYETTIPERQGHLVTIAQSIAKVFSIKKQP